MAVRSRRFGVAAWLWLGLLLLAAAVRFYALDRSSLWNDEGTTWALVQRSFDRIAQEAAADIHPPLSYWLLKVWSVPFGTSAWALRAFSALCGVALVAVTGAIARQVTPAGAARRWLPLLAGLLAALNPFLIYYSQEARMYMLLALEAATLLLLLLRLLRGQGTGGSGRDQEGSTAVAIPPAPSRSLLLLYALAAAAGLWTHYLFPVVLAALALGYLFEWLRDDTRSWRALGGFAAANVAALLLFAPWLPTALRQVTTWPQGGERVGLLEGLRRPLHTLLFGLLRPVPDPAWPAYAAAGLLPLLGLIALRRARGVWPLALLLVAPVALMAALGLFSDAFLKFLLVAAAPWCVLAAAAPEIAHRPRMTAALRGLLAAGAALLALLTLPGYYTNPAARDNYQGVARFLAAAADPARDLLVLSAPGQADVWGYYAQALGLQIPTLPLPAARPPDDAATEAALAQATAGKRTVYALLWATAQADPQGTVERWLDTHLFQGLETWQGNVRFVAYHQAADMACEGAGAAYGPLRLVEQCRSAPSRPVAAGAPLLLSLRWQADAPPGRDLAMSVQVLDGRGQVVAQQDGPPAGGAQPTSAWQAGAEVEDRRAVLIPVGTPPGHYALALVLYDPATGERLASAAGDVLPLGAVEIAAPAVSLPPDLLPVQQRTNSMLGPVRLLGYDQHKKGFAHAPETPLAPGDLLHLTLYWQAPDPRPPDWPADLTVTLTLGDASLTAPLTGGIYPTGAWAPGALVRGEFDLPYDGTARRATVTVDGDTLRLAPLPAR
jgi:hypothetical protein